MPGRAPSSVSTGNLPIQSKRFMLNWKYTTHFYHFFSWWHVSCYCKTLLLQRREVFPRWFSFCDYMPTLNLLTWLNSSILLLIQLPLKIISCKEAKWIESKNKYIFKHSLWVTCLLILYILISSIKLYVLIYIVTITFMLSLDTYINLNIIFKKRIWLIGLM